MMRRWGIGSRGKKVKWRFVVWGRDDVISIRGGRRLLGSRWRPRRSNWLVFWSLKCDEYSADVLQSQKQKTLASQEESLAKAVETAAESDKAKYVRWCSSDAADSIDQSSKKGLSPKAKHRITK
jgi:hypothetical protein